ncbi:MULTISPECIES: murein biosynthesis integral membrane protein MurJ [Candidatus Ichthyocystis]|uniref:murein biosynthesis integral membrane protein MurJ n=1 Tax=Candidatus Ichthyocystis TaxID=2929841 RepID=UPI000A4A531E|nr:MULTISPECIES: murein biosynthesis integral membrane protein MurJ [Ichthyocystis]
MSTNRLRSLATVISMTLVSRIFGLIRDTCIAHIFGAGISTDAFVVAFRLPNLLRRIFAEGAFSQAFIPLLSHTKNYSSVEETQQLINRVFTILVITTVSVTIFEYFVAKQIVSISAPGFIGKPSFDLCVTLLKITFPYIICISLTTLSAAILNVNDHFALPSVTPAILNIAMIAAAILSQLMSGSNKIIYLAWGVLTGGIVQCLVQIPSLKIRNLLPSWDINFGDKLVKKLIKQIAPAVLGVSVTQISILLNTLFASFLKTGSISWIYYADRLMEFPTGMLGAALVTVLLPEMSTAQAKRNLERYGNIVDWGLKLTFLLAIPASVAIIAIGYDIIVSLFGYGKFGIQAAIETQRALSGYSVGLLPIIAVKVLAPAFYAQQDIKTPAKLAILVLVITQTGNILLVRLYQQMGLTLSISLGAMFNATFLFYKLKSKGSYAPKPGWKNLIIKTIIGSSIMLIYLKMVEPEAPMWFQWSAIKRISIITAMCLSGCVVYFISLRATGIDIKKFLRNESQI